MKLYAVVTVVLLALLGFAQEPAADAPASAYASYTLLLVGTPQQDGVAPVVTRDNRLVFVKITDISASVRDGGSPVRFGDVLQLMGAMAQDNERLTAENEKLWKIAQKDSPAAAPLILQTPVLAPLPAPPPQDDRAAARRGMMLMLLRGMTPQRPAQVNVYQYDCTRYPALCTGR